jgi:hypothetical protein
MMQQLQSINIAQTVNMERHDSGKAAYGDDPDGRSFGDDQVSIIYIYLCLSIMFGAQSVQSQKEARKDNGLMPETV